MLFVVGAQNASTRLASQPVEAKHYGMTPGAQQSLWIGRILDEAGLGHSHPVPMRSDNEAAIKWTTDEKSPVNREIHIDVRMHVVREVVERGEFEVSLVASQLNDADFLAKPPPAESLSRASARVGFVEGLHEE
jgi:hypothetical protein